MHLPFLHRDRGKEYLIVLAFLLSRLRRINHKAAARWIDMAHDTVHGAHVGGIPVWIPPTMS